MFVKSLTVFVLGPGTLSGMTKREVDDWTACLDEQPEGGEEDTGWDSLLTGEDALDEQVVPNPSLDASWEAALSL
eukprot:g55278.t1